MAVFRRDGPAYALGGANLRLGNDFGAQKFILVWCERELGRRPGKKRDILAADKTGKTANKTFDV
jgi:hypothetical protein